MTAASARLISLLNGMPAILRSNSAMIEPRSNVWQQADQIRYAIWMAHAPARYSRRILTELSSIARGRWAAPYRTATKTARPIVAKFISIKICLQITEHRSRLATERRPCPHQAEYHGDNHCDHSYRDRRSALPVKRQRHEVHHNAPTGDRSGRNAKYDRR